MELKQIKELMAAMGRSGTYKLSLKKGDFELVLERAENGSVHSVDMPLDYSEEQLKQLQTQMRTSLALSHGGEIPAAAKNVPTASKEEISHLYILSPMVGTFYTAPSPDDQPFVKVGDKITKDTIVCIIEAMKVMNEIKSGMIGIVAEVLVESGQPIEFGTKLYRLQPESI